jgi:hypothetical protein
MEGYKHKNISKILDISVGTSKSHLARARKKLIQVLSSKAEQKKKRDRALVIWLFPESGSYIDRIYQNKFRDFEIPPGETFVAKVTEVPYKNRFSLFKTPLFYIGTVTVIALSIFFADDIFQSPPNPAEQVTIKNSTEETEAERKTNGTIPMDSEAKVTEDSIVNNKPDTIRKIVRKPVYIKKTIVVTDTIR